jgi:hypothetical protein
MSDGYDRLKVSEKFAAMGARREMRLRGGRQSREAIALEKVCQVVTLHSTSPCKKRPLKTFPPNGRNDNPALHTLKFS